MQLLVGDRVRVLDSESSLKGQMAKVVHVWPRENEGSPRWADVLPYDAENEGDWVPLRADQVAVLREE